MQFNAGIVTNGFIAATLAAFAVMLLVATRRRSETRYLAFFLLLVALNFAANGLAAILWDDLAWEAQGPWVKRATAIGLVALALDPAALLLYVASYPFDRRRGPVVWLLGASMVVGVVGATWVALDPNSAFVALSGESSGREQSVFLLLIAHLVFAYVAAWFLAVRALTEAPTEGLFERALPLVFAVGVAIVPRVGAVVLDLGPAPFLNGYGALGRWTFTSLTMALLSGLIWLPAFRLIRTLGDKARARARRTLWAIGGITLFLVSMPLIVHVAYLAGFDLGGTMSYSFRWVIFAAVLSHGIVARDAVETSRAHRRTFPVVAGFSLSVPLALATLAWLDNSAPLDGAAFALAGAVGLAGGFIGAAATRGVLTWWGARRGTGAAEVRRFELYLATIEGLAAQALPDRARRRALARERRRLGLEAGEAAAIEHVVRESGVRQREPTSLGDEPVPGLVLVEPLGEGAAGRVYLARDHRRNRDVVVKELHLGAGGTRTGRERLVTEFRAARQVRHPNVVQVHDLEVVDGRYLLLREYVPGRTLGQVIAEGPLPTARVLGMLRDLVEGLEAIHAAGLVHRDIKPSNILIGHDGRARLFDLDIATSTPVTSGLTTARSFSGGSPAGTLAYMAPEQARGKAPTTASDVYALGLIAYELLTGDKALHMQGMSLYDALQLAASPDIDLAPVPAKQRAVLGRMLAREPRERPRTQELPAAVGLDASPDAEGAGVASGARAAKAM